MHDIAIVGAGPAGAAAAIAAARLGADVLLLDRSDFPRDKACGDGIAPHVLEVLSHIGVSGVERGYPPLRRLSVRGPSGSVTAREMGAPAHVIPRLVFDARLVEAAVEAGAKLRRHTVRHIESRVDRVVLDGMQARVAIGADGANSVVRRHLGAPLNPPGHLAIAIRGYASHDGEPVQEILMDGSEWPAYAWSFPIGDGRRNVGFGQMLRAAPISRAHLLGRLHDLLPGLAGVHSLRAHHLPLSTRRPPAGRGRILLAGDALSLINPFTGEGIFYAVLSGALAGQVAATGAPDAGQRYSALLAERLGGHLRHTGLIARLGRFPHVIDAGIQAAQRDQRVFDALVELGLGDGRLTARVLGGVAQALTFRGRWGRSSRPSTVS